MGKQVEGNLVGDSARVVGPALTSHLTLPYGSFLELLLRRLSSRRSAVGALLLPEIENSGLAQGKVPRGSCYVI
ncbi:hypothetical protein KM043_017833 [Ampulex compressa]|nr:hypothetical protein KM043_017833 [Ampulex compressa]